MTAVRVDGEVLGVRHRHLQKKGTALLDVLERALGASPLAEGVEVRRVGLLADGEAPLFAAVSLQL